MKNSEVSAYIACAIEASLLVVNTDPHRGTRRRAATTLLHAIQVRQMESETISYDSLHSPSLPLLNSIRHRKVAKLVRSYLISLSS